MELSTLIRLAAGDLEDLRGLGERTLVTGAELSWLVGLDFPAASAGRTFIHRPHEDDPAYRCQRRCLSMKGEAGKWPSHVQATINRPP